MARRFHEPISSFYNQKRRKHGLDIFLLAGRREDVWEPEDDINWGKEITSLLENRTTHLVQRR